MVEDPFGRIVYVPDLHYHNTRTNKQEEEEEEEEEEEKIDFGLFDFFTYKIFSNGIEIKEPNHVWRINLRVFNLPSEIVFLPPVQFKAPFDARRGDNVSVSIFLSDPEIFTKIFEQDKHIEYHIQVKAIDGFSEFIIPHTLYGISEENILTLCGVIRPCWISLVENETTSSLSLLIKESNWNPSHFELKGNLRTIQQAFKQVLIRDWSLSVDEDKKRRHVCAFQISATRIVPVNSALSNSSAWMELKVVYVSQNEYALLKSSSLNLKHTILSKNSIFWMIFIAWFLWFVLLYAGCACGCWCDCLCCCCLSHRLEKKRQRYKQKAKEDYETFKDKVVQTDEEYNILLYHIADLIFEPDLEIATSLYRCICLQGSLTSQIVAVESLLILLETERQGLRFVTKLVLQDLVKIPKSAKHQKYLLCTDFLKEFTKNALGFFCSMHMDSNMMIDKLKDFLIFCSMDNSPFRLAISIIHFFQCHHEFLPVEIIIICRVFSVVGSDIASTSTRRLELVHEVFFYYFLGPVLCQSFEGDSSLYQMTRLFYLIEATWDSEIVTEVADEVVEEIEEQFAFQEMYENFLNFLLESSTLCSSFVPGDKGKSKDPHLLSLCMMNLHSLLDQYMGSLMLHYNETPRFHETQEMEDDSIRRKPLHNVFLLKELVDALSLPFVGCIDGINIVSPDWYIHRHQLELWRQEFLDSFQPFNGLSNPEETRLRRWSNSHSQSEDHHDFEDLEMGSCTLIPPYGGSHDSFHGVDHTNAPYAPYRQPSL
jgi:hypothetical protein